MADTFTGLTATADGIRLHVKVVPGASRTKIAGVLGERLKLAVAAPPEAGQANRAVCELLAAFFAVPQRDVLITAGQNQPMKTIEIVGVTACAATEKLNTALRRPPPDRNR